MFLKILLTVSLLLFTLSSATSESAVDFCVANLKLPRTPSGYPCRDPATLTTNDFVYTGLRVPGNRSSLFNVSVNEAFDVNFPALNGLGISMARLDFDIGGVVAVHTHRVSETIFLIEGSIIAGFIAADNTPYYKVLKPGDLMIFPHFLLHFQINVGDTRALAVVSLNSANPGIQFTSGSLFGNNLPTEIVHEITLVSREEVERLKQLLRENAQGLESFPLDNIIGLGSSRPIPM